MIPLSSSSLFSPHLVHWFEETECCNQILLVFLSAPDIFQTTWKMPSWLVGRMCLVCLSSVFPQCLLRNPFFYVCPLIVWTSDQLHQTHISNLFFSPSGLDRKNRFSLGQIHLFALMISIWISHQHKFLSLTCLGTRSLSQPFLSFFPSEEVKPPDNSSEFHIHSRFRERIPGVKMLSSPLAEYPAKSAQQCTALWDFIAPVKLRVCAFLIHF